MVTIETWLHNNLIVENNHIPLYDTCTWLDQQMIMNALERNWIDFVEADKDVVYYVLTVTGRAAVFGDAYPAPQAEAERGTAEHPEYNLGIFLGKYRHLPHANIGNQTACGNFVQGEFKSEVLHKLPICPECMEASRPAAPQPVTPDAGEYRTEWRNADYGIVSPSGHLFLSSNSTADTELIDQLAYSLNQETQALRSQLQAANDKIADYKHIMDNLRIGLKRVQTQLDDGDFTGSRMSVGNILHGFELHAED